MKVHSLTALLVLAPALAHAEPTRFEIALTSEAHWLVDSSGMVTSENESDGAFTATFAYSPLAMLDVYAGYRALYEVSRGDKGYSMSTDGDAAIAGARVRYPILSWFGVVGSLDVEALHLEHDFAVNERSGSTGEWTFGVVPRAGLELTLDLDSWACLLRIEGGYAFRGPASVSMTLDSDAAEVDPIDLGTVDLSGPVFGLSLGIRF